MYGVNEYWIVNPMKESVLVYTLQNGGHDMLEIYSFKDKIKINVFEDLEIDFASFVLWVKLLHVGDK